jgi:hypothetical protein
LSVIISSIDSSVGLYGIGSWLIADDQGEQSGILSALIAKTGTDPNWCLLLLGPGGLMKGVDLG